MKNGRHASTAMAWGYSGVKMTLSWHERSRQSLDAKEVKSLDAKDAKNAKDL
jgi:hypothetical protein